MDSLLAKLLELGFSCTPVFDGEYHRFDRNGKTLSGWFKGIMVQVGDACVYEATFGDWVTGERHEWKEDSATSNMTPEQLAELTAKRKAAAEKDAKEKLWRQEQAAKDANRLYNSALKGAASHPYVVKKKIRPGDHAKTLGDKLCLPAWVKHEITSIQLIAADGAKKFLSGGRLDMAYTIWREGPHTFGPTLYMCEGYATGASVGMALDVPVLVCFNTSNMVKIAGALEAVTGFGFKKVVICADNDGKTKGNPGVKAARQAQALLEKAGIKAEIRTPRCDAGVAMDWNDVHVAHGLDFVRRELTDTTQPEPPTPEPEPPGPSSRPGLPSLDDFEKLPVRKDDEGEIIPPTQFQIVNALLDGFGDVLMREGKEVFLWCGTHWEEQDPIDFKFLVKRAAMKIRHGKAKEKELNDIYSLFLGYLPRPPAGQSFYRQDPRLSNFQDGTLEVVREGHAYRLHFRGHARADLLTWVLPYEHGAARPTNGTFRAWLARCFEGDPDSAGKMRALAQIGGAALVSLFPRYVFLYGPGGSGKSTFAKLCMRFLSPKNVCSVEPKDQGGSFGKELMVNKQANIVTDISGARIDSALFKRAEDRAPEYINRKNRSAVMGYLPALSIFCANPNQLPKGIDAESGAMNRRVSIVHFEKVIPEVLAEKHTRDYEQIMLEAGPGDILGFFLEGLADLCANGGRYLNPESGVAVLKEWKDQESLTAQFLDALAHGEVDGFKLDPGGRVLRSKLGGRLATWAGDRLSTHTIHRLFHELEARGFKAVKVQGQRFICGIRVAGEDLGGGEQVKGHTF